MSQQTGAVPRVPTCLRVAVGLLWVEATAVAVLSGFLFHAAATHRSTDLGTALAAAGFPLLLGVVLAALAWQLHRLRSWARGPAIVLELLMLPIGYYMIEGGAAWAGIPVMLCGLGGAGALLAPSTREGLGIH